MNRQLAFIISGQLTLMPVRARFIKFGMWHRSPFSRNCAAEHPQELHNILCCIAIYGIVVDGVEVLQYSGEDETWLEIG